MSNKQFNIHSFGEQGEICARDKNLTVISI